MNFNFLLFCIFALPTIANAIVGHPSAVTSVGPDNICRILISDSHGVGICSGTLIHSNQILTAAHCIDDITDESKIKVSCGYRGFDQKKLKSQKTKSGNTIFISGINFLQEAIGINSYAHLNWEIDSLNFDIALITLDHDMKIEPMAVVDPKTISKPIQCSAAGYGINKNINMGFLQVGTLDTQNLQKNSFSFIESNFTSTLTDPREEDNLLLEVPTILKYADRNTMQNSVAVFGDSGGPVFCHYKNKNSIFQVGIVRAVYYSRVQRAKTNVFDISYTTAFSVVDAEFSSNTEK